MTQGRLSDGLAANFVKTVVSAESVTGSAVSAASGVMPAQAMEAICHSVDADMYITTGETPVASPTAGVYLKSGEKAYFTPTSGHKIAIINV
jgi:hypothetical protein